MSKNYRRLCAVLGLGLVCGTGALTARSASIPVTATYSDIKITYNGQQKIVTDEHGNVVEPFAINGTTYVPVRGVGQIFGVDATWNGPSKTIILTGGSTGSMSTTQINEYMNRINTLQTQLTAAQNEIALLKANGATTNSTSGTSSTITVNQLDELEEKLNDNFSTELSGIDFDFDVKRSSSSSKFVIDLTYSKSTGDSNFKKLLGSTSNSRKLNNFLEDVCTTVVSQYPGNSVEGTIYYNNTERYSYTYSKSGKFEGTAIIELSSGDVEDYIEDEYKNLDSSNVSTVTIRDTNVSINTNKETISCELYIDRLNDDNIKKWNDANRDKELENELSKLVEDIEDHFNTDYTISVSLYDYIHSSNRVGYFKNNDLDLDDWN